MLNATLYTRIRSYLVGSICVIISLSFRLRPHFVGAKSEGSGDTVRLRKLV